MSYIAQVSIDGGNALPVGSRLYGTCSTAADTAVKVVALPEFDRLIEGVTVYVKFTNANTAVNPELKVGSTESASILSVATESAIWNEGSVVSFTYDGSSWVMNGIQLHQDISLKANLLSPDFAGTPTAPTAPNGTHTSQIATTEFVMNAFTANDAMVFKGTLGLSGTVQSLPAYHETGWTYKVATAGTYAGQNCEVGDVIICVSDGLQETSLDWAVVQSNIDGALIEQKADRYSGVYKVTSSHSSAGSYWSGERLDCDFDLYQDRTIIVYEQKLRFVGADNVWLKIEGCGGSSDGSSYFWRDEDTGESYSSVNGVPVYQDGGTRIGACPAGTLFLMYLRKGRFNIIARTNMSYGNVNGPESSVSGNVAIFSGTDGKSIQDSGYIIAKSVPSDAQFTDTTYTATAESIGSASLGEPLSAHRIQTWSPGSATILSVSRGVLSVTPGTDPALEYVATPVQTIDVSTKSVLTSITAD